jgi:hypothetical protein
LRARSRRAAILSSRRSPRGWVILWVPIGLLVYDRWYYSRDRKIYRRMEDMEIRIARRPGDSPAPLGD